MVDFSYHYLDSCDSTNEVAKNCPPFTLVHAGVQTKGKGRCGRVWESGTGNLYMSITLPLVSQAPLYSFIAALAVAETISFLCPRIKWPNDILIDGRKVCGILLETTDNLLIIGIGVNVESCPNIQTLYKTTCLKDYGAEISSKELAQKILQNLKNEISLYQEKGFTPIQRQWLEYATGIGKNIEVRLPHQTMQGIFEGLDNDGALRLKTKDGTIHKITAGDVFMI